MKLTLLITGIIVPALANYHAWAPPGPGDVRAPCPVLNSLANHGFLPHDGKNIDINTTIRALAEGVNIDAELATFLYGFAVSTNPEPNATVFSLENLGRHNVLEHDASLSRGDALVTGDGVSFNQTVFDETKSYFKTPIINVTQAASARVARIITSNTTNPYFFLSDLGNQFDLGETGAYLMVFGDKVKGEAPRKFVEFVFENERLPYELGWNKPAEPLSMDDLFAMMARIDAAVAVPPGLGYIPPANGSSETDAEKRKRRSGHWGFLH